MAHFAYQPSECTILISLIAFKYNLHGDSCKRHVRMLSQRVITLISGLMPGAC